MYILNVISIIYKILTINYCREQNDKKEDSCARVDAILIRRKDSKSHVKGE